MKWTKFKDGLPSNPIIYETDFKAIWTSSRAQYYGGAAGCVFDWSGYAKSYPDRAWAEIPIPEVPDEPIVKHHCESEDGNHQCFEVSHQLIINYCGHMPWICKFCPFCGYSIKEKE